MRKILLSVALLCAAMCMNAENRQAIERDTVVWDKGIRTEINTRLTPLGEKRTCHRAILFVKDGEKEVRRSIIISRATYEALEQGKQAYVVYTVYDDGSERITKVITL